MLKHLQTMITLGIDISSQAAKTAMCKIEWGTSEITHHLFTRCKDEVLDEQIENSDFVGIDAPFGWPQPFVEAVAGWKLTEWNDEQSRKLRLRFTDDVVYKKTKINPLSVSSDRIALPAMRTMALLNRHGVTDRVKGKFCEVYPAASLYYWNLERKGYKDSNKGLEIRKQITDELQRRLPKLKNLEEYIKSDHALDALIAALTARAAAMGWTLQPDTNQMALAQQEGWIHLPDVDCLLKL